MSFFNKFTHELHKTDHISFAQFEMCKFLRENGAEGQN